MTRSVLPKALALAFVVLSNCLATALHSSAVKARQVAVDPSPPDPAPQEDLDGAEAVNDVDQVGEEEVEEEETEEDEAEEGEVEEDDSHEDEVEEDDEGEDEELQADGGEEESEKAGAGPLQRNHSAAAANLAAEAGAEQSAACHPARRAFVAQGLLADFEARYKSRFAAALRDVRSPAYLSVGDWRYRMMLRNFMAHAHNVSCFRPQENITMVHVGLDNESHQECLAISRGINNTQPAPAAGAAAGAGGGRRGRGRGDGDAGGGFRIRCVDLSGWLSPELFKDRAATAWTCAYNMLLWTKPHILIAAVEASEHAVLMIDTDIILHENLINLAEMLAAGRGGQGGGKLVISGRERGGGKPNTGTIWANQTALPLLRRWAELDSQADFLNAKEGDQSALQDLILRDPDTASKLGSFNVLDVGQCMIRGRWATHYNCGGSKNRKMMRHGDWDPQVQREPPQLDCSSLTAMPLPLPTPSSRAKKAWKTWTPRKRRPPPANATKKKPRPPRTPPPPPRALRRARWQPMKRRAGQQRQQRLFVRHPFQTAYQTNRPYYQFPAEHAIDGYFNTRAGCNHDCMWLGDLGVPRNLSLINVSWEACNCNASDSMMLEISSDNETWELFATMGGFQQWGGFKRISAEGEATGRYVRLRPSDSYQSLHRSDRWWSLREVEAFGAEAPPAAADGAHGGGEAPGGAACAGVGRAGAAQSPR